MKGSRSTQARKKSFVLHFIATLADIAQTCRRTGVTRRTYNRWMLDDQYFQENIIDALEDSLDWVESQIKLGIQGRPIRHPDTNEITGWEMKPDLRIAVDYMKAKGKHRGWVDRIETSQVRQPQIIVQTEKDRESLERFSKASQN
jgi:hypothetical protein